MPPTKLVSATEMQNQSYSLSVTYGNWGKITSYSLAKTDMQSRIAGAAGHPVGNNPT